MDFLLKLLANKVELQRTESIKKSIKLQVIGGRVCHAVFCLRGILFFRIVRLIFCPVQVSHRFAVRQVEELSFFTQVASARPKVWRGFKLKV